ncbi:MAG: alginate export family protein [Planctomycetota bacterium]|nr:alginate export family protein [Planctomycetota bacterium]
MFKLGLGSSVLPRLVAALGVGTVALGQDAPIPPPMPIRAVPTSPARNPPDGPLDAPALPSTPPARSNPALRYGDDQPVRRFLSLFWRDMFTYGSPDEPRYIGPPNWPIAPPIASSAPPTTGKQAPRPLRAPLYYDNDFRYLDDPNNEYVDAFDFAKRIPLAPNGRVKVDFGGEYRLRLADYSNQRLNGVSNDLTLNRFMAYSDLWVDDTFRIFFQGIDAQSAPQKNEPPLLIDINRWDLLDGFGEIKFYKHEKDYASFRFGREEMNFGNQRFVSNLDWVNTRRTFDDVARLLYRSGDWDFDAFWSRPNQIRPLLPDRPIYGQSFMGLYSVYKGFKYQTIDTYFLDLVDTAHVVTGRFGTLGGYTIPTIGARWSGDYKGWLWETEDAYQFGKQADMNRSAWSVTTGAGRRRSDWWATPELWFYFDYASGTKHPGSGTYSTFNQLFPLAHKYFGFLDLIGRQNIIDLNSVLVLKPTSRIRLLAWYHHFMLDSATDALYNAQGLPSRIDPTGRSGRNVGDEIDFILDLVLSPHNDFQLGYSTFSPGGFIEHTGVGSGASFFYGMYTFRF